MPNNKTYNFGYNMNNWAEDGLSAAWGCRAIVNYEKGILNRTSPLQLLGNRQSSVGTPRLCRILVDIWNNHRLSEAVERFTVDNHRKEDVVHDLWEETDNRLNPLEVKIRFAGGYAYIRVGLRAPEPMSEIRTYEEWKERGSKDDEYAWYGETRAIVGSLGTISGHESTVLTYVHEGAFQYGIAHTPTWWAERYGKPNTSAHSNFFSDRYPYGRPWAYVLNFVPHEWQDFYIL